MDTHWRYKWYNGYKENELVKPNSNSRQGGFYFISN